MKMKIAVVCAALSLLAQHTTANTTDVTEIIDVAPEDIHSSPEYCATCVKLDSLCYNRSYLFELTANFRTHIVVKKMGILRSNNVLYYSFEPKLEDPEYFKVAYVSLDTPDLVNSTINDGNTHLTFNFSVFDFNQNENKLYLGGSDGIWSLANANTDRPVLRFFAAKGHKITDLVSKDYVYFTETDTQGIIKDKNGDFFRKLENKTIESFVLDKDVEYTVVYLHSTGLYAFNSKTNEDVRLSTNRFFRGLTVDLEGIVYAWYIDGIYKVILDSVLAHSTVVRVSDIEVGAMTFDNSNNIIYSNGKSLYRLTKTDTTKC
ncbi:ommochrome-binding protein-like [Leguminivora glycinivorella]|uniref:ommochrome-binding protein-like n=1 Tax=Leguminivora glycinivorella TaxID=1035111 RepID=UPI0020101964|nr:ommochrome-binding protein-like [Leguminivora glycinivorella]